MKLGRRYSHKRMHAQLPLELTTGAACAHVPLGDASLHPVGDPRSLQFWLMRPFDSGASDESLN
jgi:hypothetical protein